MKKVLITGAAGFLGSHLCDKFLNEGYYVIGMDNFITGDEDNIRHLDKNNNFQFIPPSQSGFRMPGTDARGFFRGRCTCGSVRSRTPRDGQGVRQPTARPPVSRHRP